MESNHPNNWQEEAAGVINDIKTNVNEILISTKLQTTNSCVYLNVTTFEERKLCIKLSADGFDIVGHSYDSDNLKLVTNRQIYETPYALLSDISPLYIQSFGNSLINALNGIK